MGGGGVIVIAGFSVSVSVSDILVAIDILVTIAIDIDLLTTFLIHLLRKQRQHRIPKTRLQKSLKTLYNRQRQRLIPLLFNRTVIQHNQRTKEVHHK